MMLKMSKTCFVKKNIVKLGLVTPISLVLIECSNIILFYVSTRLAGVHFKKLKHHFWHFKCHFFGVKHANFGNTNATFRQISKWFHEIGNLSIWNLNAGVLAFIKLTPWFGWMFLSDHRYDKIYVIFSSWVY